MTKEEKKVYDKAYRLANREKLLQQHKDWLSQNPDYQKQYDDKNPRKEQRSTSNKARYVRDKERIKANVSSYRKNKQEEDPEAWALMILKKNRLWSKTHPEEAQAKTQRHQARKRVAGGSYTAQEWIDLKAELGNVCLYCGTPESERPLTVDHVIPVLLGGSTDITNLQPLCKPCNSRKGADTTDYRPQEYNVTGTCLQGSESG